MPMWTSSLRPWALLASLLLVPDVSRSRVELPPHPVFAPQPIPNPEHEPLREQFRLPVEPFRILGNSRPGPAAEDIDDPNGLAFDQRGLLLATDSRNLRIQVWDVQTGRHVGSFGSAAKIPKGEMVDLAVAPDGTVLVTDEERNRAYAFAPAAQGGEPYTFLERDPLPGETYKKLGGILIDASSNIYTVDAELNVVRKHGWDGAPDPSWRFPLMRTEKDTFLKNAEGIALDEERGTLYVASEFDFVVHLFDARTGAFRKQAIGAHLDPATNELSGTHVFTGSWSIYSGSPEGLSLLHGYLFAVDEFAGHVHIFDTLNPAVYNRDLVELARLERAARGSSGYVGFVGHTPVIALENQAHKKQIKQRQLNPAAYNPPGFLCSPDSVATYFDEKEGEGYIAVADQCNYRIVVYRWSEIARAASLARR
ncbi:MAG: hypothetical protein U1A78_41210 [Polyangia bacterium]